MEETLLFAVREISDIYVDAAIRDPSGELIFLSMYGRDTVALQFLASFSLPAGQGGLRAFTLERGAESHTLKVAQPERLQKLTGRLPRNNLFGNLTHTWLYREDAIKPDRVNRRALLLRHDESVTEFADRCWRQLVDLCPVPLLDHWRTALLEALSETLISPLADSDAPPIGTVDGAYLTIHEGFEAIISMAILKGALTLAEDAMPSDAVQRIRQAAQAVRAKGIADDRPELFELGRVLCTQGVQSLVEADKVNPELLLRRHQRGDWGVVSEPGLNDRAVRSGERILSAYPIDSAMPCHGYGDNTIWVITECDRSATTLLLPGEY